MDPESFMNWPDSPLPVDSLLRMSAHSCSDNNLKFICEFKPGPGPPPAGEEDCNADMGCKSVSVILPAQCSIYQLRLQICMQVGTPLLDGLFKSVCKMCFLPCTV